MDYCSLSDTSTYTNNPALTPAQNAGADFKVVEWVKGHVNTS
jgi:hypothetical protein